MIPADGCIFYQSQYNTNAERNNFSTAWEATYNYIRLEPYWYIWIKSGSTFQGSILKISREYIFPKFVFPITLPRDASLVHIKLLVIARKVISIIKQTPRNKTTRNNRCLIRCGVLGLTGICILQAPIIPQLLITSALHISNISLQDSLMHYPQVLQALMRAKMTNIFQIQVLVSIKFASKRLYFKMFLKCIL